MTPPTKRRRSKKAAKSAETVADSDEEEEERPKKKTKKTAEEPRVEEPPKQAEGSGSGDKGKGKEKEVPQEESGPKKGGETGGAEEPRRPKKPQRYFGKWRELELELRGLDLKELLVRTVVETVRLREEIGPVQKGFDEWREEKGKGDAFSAYVASLRALGKLADDGEEEGSGEGPEGGEEQGAE